MRHLPHEEILSRQKPGSAANQKTRATPEEAHREARACRSPRQNSARTIIQSLARHVDPATSKTWLF